MKSLFCSLMIGLSATIASAQIAPAMVNNAGAPLKLISINCTLEDFLHTVTFRNVSSRTITSFQLGLIMSVPPTCGPREIYGEEKLLRQDRVSIAPAVIAETKDYAVSPASIARFGSDNYAQQVLSQLAIVRVEFSDGTVWSFNRNDRVYDRASLAANAQLQCSPSSKVALYRTKATLNAPA